MQQGWIKEKPHYGRPSQKWVADKWVDICIGQLKTELMISQVFGLDYMIGI
jgi:hypothetical protein